MVTPLKRYLLFAGDAYYPAGGWADFKGSFDTLFEAMKASRKEEWYEIVDLELGEVTDDTHLREPL